MARFANFNAAIKTIIGGRSSAFMTAVDHTHDEDCSIDCKGFYLSIDLTGSGTESGMTPLAVLHEERIPDGVTLLCELWLGKGALNDKEAELTALQQEYRRAVESAWRWHGQPDCCIWYPSLIWVDSSLPRLDVTVVAPDLSFTSSGSSDVTAALQALFVKEPLAIAAMRIHPAIQGLADARKIWAAHLAASSIYFAQGRKN